MRRRLAVLTLALATLGTIGTTAARASTPTPGAGLGERPWACAGERDVNVGICLYSPVPPAPPGLALPN